MNFWKPLALVSMSSLAMVVGYDAASAGNGKSDPTTVQAAQPNMEAALKSLQSAKASLEKAEHNKGGWRANAIIVTDLAISETKRGIEFADGK